MNRKPHLIRWLAHDLDPAGAVPAPNQGTGQTNATNQAEADRARMEAQRQASEDKPIDPSTRTKR